MSEPAWLVAGRNYLGVREIPGAPTQPIIARWLAKLPGAWWKDDETPWCGTAVAAVMQECNISLPRHWYRAKGWLDWGTAIVGPAVGAVVVFQRDGGGHVGLIVGKDSRGRLMVWGGNQGNRVWIDPFDMDRVLGYRWPTEHLASLMQGNLPLLASSGQSSKNEA